MGCQKVNASHCLLTAIDKRCAALSYYTAYSDNSLLTSLYDNSLLTFQDNLTVPLEGSRNTWRKLITLRYTFT